MAETGSAEPVRCPEDFTKICTKAKIIHATVLNRANLLSTPSFPVNIGEALPTPPDPFRYNMAGSGKRADGPELHEYKFKDEKFL